MKAYECNQCHFQAQEKQKECPICNKEMQEIEKEISFDPNLPKQIPSQDRAVQLGYYCFTCKKVQMNQICLVDNNINSLCLLYNGKKAIIKRIHHLRDVFDEEEVLEISKQLTEQEKHWLYHHFAGAYRFFYRKDKNKAIVSFVMALVMYVFCFLIAANFAGGELHLLVPVFNGLANTMAFIFIVLGIWYLIDASQVEYAGIPKKVGILAMVFYLIYVVVAIVLELSFTDSYLFGGGIFLLQSIVYLGLAKKEGKQ